MTTQREIADQLGLPIHPPKVEVFDLPAGTNTDSKHLVRPVDEFRVEPFGLYMARPMVDHPRADYVESWLLPELGIRVTDWHLKPGCAREQDFYVDIAAIEPGAQQWRSVDHYLDLLVHTGERAQVLDVDEFLTAVRADLLDGATAEAAMRTAYAVLDGLVAHDHDLPAWLRAQGIELSWRGRE